MAHFKKKKYLELAKGFFRTRKNCPRVMINAVHKKLMYSYRDRRVRRRLARRNSIQTIGIAVTKQNKCE